MARFFRFVIIFSPCRLWMGRHPTEPAEGGKEAEP
jgi:hypothetical protein